jgi:hypothetical protein
MDISIYKQNHGSHINIFKKDKKSMIHSKLFVSFFWKIPCIETLFILETCLDGKKF